MKTCMQVEATYQGHTDINKGVQFLFPIRFIRPLSTTSFRIAAYAPRRLENGLVIGKKYLVTVSQESGGRLNDWDVEVIHGEI